MGLSCSSVPGFGYSPGKALIHVREGTRLVARLDWKYDLEV